LQAGSSDIQLLATMFWTHRDPIGRRETKGFLDMRTRLAAAVLMAISGWIGSAASAEPAAKSAPSTVIAPILGQVVSFTLPAGFAMQKEQSSSLQYFHGGFRKGETADTWTQMVAITAGKNMDPDPKKTAQFIAASIANDIKKHCPDTFSVKPLGPSKINGQDAFVAITSCGKVGSDKHSETALTVTIKGVDAIYSIQWAERAPSNAENLTIDENKWKDRLKQLIPIHVCPIVAGEKAPYPSCSDSK
jgi:hypothetical protein